MYTLLPAFVWKWMPKNGVFDWMCVCSFQQSSCEIRSTGRESEEHVASHDQPCVWLPGRSAAARRSSDRRPRSHAFRFCFHFYILTWSKHSVFYSSAPQVHFAHFDMNRLDHMPINWLLQLAGLQTLDFSESHKIIDIWRERELLRHDGAALDACRCYNAMLCLNSIIANYCCCI